MGEFSDIDVALENLEGDSEFRSAVDAVAPGFLRHDRDCPVFRRYRLYSAALETFVEEPPVMREILSDPLRRIGFFRLFGYRGEIDFTMMPSVWVRDLPLLDIGRDAHLGYGMALGTGRICATGVQLKTIRLGERSVFAQHSVVEGGTRIGKETRVGIRGIVGPDCMIGDSVELSDFARLSEGVSVRDGARIGEGAVVGAGAVIDEGVRIEDRAEVPAWHRVTEAGVFPLPQSRRETAGAGPDRVFIAAE